MNIRISHGDTLSKLASKYGTSVAALRQANPQIKKASLIHAGRQLNIPGATDSFEPPKAPPAPTTTAPTTTAPATTAPATTAPTTTAPAPAGPASSALSIAQSHLGKNAASLKLENSPVGRAMADWVGNKVNCASFVAGCLQAAGQIDHSDYSASCTYLANKLDRSGKFSRVSLSNASPGDVVIFSTPSGGRHAVLFAGMRDGRPTYIGSNNVNADGTQRISMARFKLPILSIQHYVG